MLAGLEPEVTDRVLEIPALAELRKAIAERIQAEQLAGTVRTDIDPIDHRQRHRRRSCCRC